MSAVPAGSDGAGRAGDSGERAAHWDAAYADRGTEGVSWFQPEPRVSLELLESLGVPRDTPVVDVGGGASLLVDRLLDLGYGDLTVLDVSGEALAAARTRVPGDAPVEWLRRDVLAWQPERPYGLWHDRAVFHFLVDAADRATYVGALRAATAPGALVVLATFAPDGPDRCSGLPVARYGVTDLAAVINGNTGDPAGDDFTVVASRRELHTTPGGATQPFTWVALRRRPRPRRSVGKHPAAVVDRHPFHRGELIQAPLPVQTPDT